MYIQYLRLFGIFTQWLSGLVWFEFEFEVLQKHSYVQVCALMCVRRHAVLQWVMWLFRDRPYYLFLLDACLFDISSHHTTLLQWTLIFIGYYCP